MSFLNRAYKFLTAEHTLILLALLVAAVFLMQYSSLKSNIVGAMTSGDESNGQFDGDEKKPKKSHLPKPALPSGNSGPAYAAQANSVQTITSGLPPTCTQKVVTNPAELLPRNSNGNWNELNPSGSGELANMNLLKAGYHAGVDTIGSTLRNANLQVRSEPPNPKANVSPWLNSTIEPDLMRAPLEIGCGPQMCER